MHSSDRAVFVTDDDRRGRRLRRGAFAATGLACLWLIGLGIGVFGFGSLPGISLGSDKPDKADRPAPQPAAGRFSPIARPLGSEQQAQANVAAGRRQPGSRARGRSPVEQAPARPPAVAPPPPAQEPVNPAGRQRGWARKGLPAPPGQVRKALPKPPPGARGQRRGQTSTTTTTTPLPPGQAKKTPPPPPEG